MPDWFYRTVSQPVLFRLPAALGRDLALRFMGTLARLPLGPAIIDLLGHMHPDKRLQETHLGIAFPTVVGLGARLDGAALALPALARFGFGFLEVGPVSVVARPEAPPQRRLEEQAIWYPEPPWGLHLGALLPRLAPMAHLGVPVLARLAETSTLECRQLIQALAPHVGLFSVPLTHEAPEEEWKAHVEAVATAVRSVTPQRPLLLNIPADLGVAKHDTFLRAAVDAGVQGFVIDGSVRAPPSDCLVGLPAREPALALVRMMRECWGNDVLLIASGGVHEPEDALALRAAGADLVTVDSGLVFGGPGLPKRINDALLFLKTRTTEAEATSAPRPAETTWLWTTLLGAGMFVGSILALIIAATQIVLPYDETFAGLAREQMKAINPRLLSFLAHDRVSLAGTMIAVGVLYLGLSLYGVRSGMCWARQTIFVSAFIGFGSFFLFLGFGYLDPFHAFVTAVLLQLLLLGVHSRLGVYRPEVAPALRSDRTWRRALWGQLLLVIHGGALMTAGFVISSIGVTSVFVPEDLAFMGTTAEALRSANPRLVPLIAHDRATMGGMLLSAGAAFLLIALWGYRNGSRWLWWTLLAGGVPAYVAALGVHFAVGYTDLGHLLPVFAGLGLFLIGLALSYSYLCGSNPRYEADWHRFLAKR
jgi:dihydroorotate dehydrogenase